MPPQPATLVEGKYEVLAKIREGGMGTIYKVRHRLLDEIRVIKVMRPNVAADDDFKRRFLDEAKTATRLKHPNICAIHDFALDADGVSYLVMEYIDGVTLGDLLKAQGSVKVPLALEITHQTLLALGYLHKKKIVHRDIAPDNLMLTVDEEGESTVKLIDLGIAKVLDRDANMTSSGVFLGKLRYASPEQYGTLPQGSMIDGRSDLYSMGLVLYELLTGKRPFIGETPIELMRAHVYNTPTPFNESDPKGLVAEEIRQIVFKALQKNRDDRFPTAQDFDRALVTAIARNAPQRLAVDEPTVILGIKAMKLEDPTVTPSAQDRLDFQFAPGRTPAPAPLHTLRPIESDSEAQQRQKKELEDIRAREGKRDLAGLQRLLESGSLSAASFRELGGAIERLKRLAEEEQKQKAEQERQRVEEERRKAEEEKRRVELEKQREEADWRKANEDKSVDQWERYLAEHGDSPRKEQAKRGLAEARDFRQASNLETREGWLAFQSKWPDGAHKADALAHIKRIEARDEEALNRAKAAGSVKAYQEFLAAHAASHVAAAAKTLLAEQTDFDAVAKDDGEPAWRGFLSRWPQGARTATAKKRLDASRQREDGAWQEASGKGTAPALETFLQGFPSGRYHEQAERLLRELAEFERAEKEGKTGYERFLKEHPSSRHAKSARDKLKELEEAQELARIRKNEETLQAGELESLLRNYPAETTTVGSAAAAALLRVRKELDRRKEQEEEAAWNLANTDGTEAAWEGFLGKHPDSARREEATQRRAEAHDFGEASDLNSYDGWTSFQEKWAEGAHRDAALAHLEAIRGKIQEALGRAEADGSARAYRAFLEAHKSSHLTSRAKSLLAEQTDFDQVQAHDTEDAWRGFLERWPAGLRIGSATHRLEAAREREEQRWQEASEEGSAPSLLGFLQAFPSGKHHREAESLLRELTDLDEAQKQGKTGYERFLKEHPQSRHAKAARAKLQELKQVKPVKPAPAAAAAKSAETAPISPPAPEPRRIPMEPPILDETLKAKVLPPPAPRITEPEPDPNAAPAPPPRRTGRNAAIAAAVLVAAVGMWLWLRPTAPTGVAPTPAQTQLQEPEPQAQAQPQAPPVAAPRAEPKKLEPSPAAPVVAPGDLAINVLPWGRVERVQDADGRKWQDGLPQYTPLLVHLPPGKYSVIVSNPNFAEPITIAVEVRTGERTVGSGRFEAIDPKAYFRSQGLGQ